MKSIFRSTVALLLLSLLAVVLAACGSGGGGGGGSSSSNSAGSTVNGQLKASYINGVIFCVNETLGTANPICDVTKGQGNFTLQYAVGKELAFGFDDADNPGYGIFLGYIPASDVTNSLIISPATLCDGDAVCEQKTTAFFHQAGTNTGSGEDMICDLGSFKITLPEGNNLLGWISNGIMDTVVINGNTIEPWSSVAKYKFDEGSGTKALNSFTDGLHGDIYGPVRSGGKVGQALSFSNAGDRVVISMVSGNSRWDEIDFSNNNITIDAWIKLQSLGSGTIQNIIGSGYYGLRCFRLQINGGELQFLLADPNNNSWQTIITGNQVLTTGIWHHIAITFNGSEARTYIDGILDNTSLITYPIPNNYNSLYIGAVSSAGFGYENDFYGFIDELRIYNALLSSTDIDAYYQSSK